MRLKIILPVLLVAAAVIIIALRQKHPQPAPIIATMPITNAPVAVQPEVATTIPDSNAPAKPVTVSLFNTNGMSAHDIYIHEEMAKLWHLQANDDTDSLHQILADMTNSEKQIRWAAVNAAIQFGSRDAIPVMTNLATQTADPQEKKHLLDSADYLALPSWSEVHQQDPNAKLGKPVPFNSGSQPNSP